MSREMKDSGIEWIGEIPKDWKVCRIKNIFNRKNSKAKQENPVILSLARSGVKIRDISTNEGQIAESYYSYNPVETFDLLINPMDLYSGANCSCSKVSGVISPAYINIRAKKGVDPFYYDYYLKTQYWSKALFAHGKGVSFDNRWTLSVDTFMNYYVPFPPYGEQCLIAEFLRDKCGYIEEIQEKTKSSIEELKNIKQAIITQSITKGVYNKRKLKKSNIKWIGEIPIEWKITPLKYCATLRAGITLGKKYESNVKLIKVPYLRVANVQGNYIDLSNMAEIDVEPKEVQKYLLHKGEILMTEGGDRDKLGRGTIWNGEINPCIHQNHVFALKVDENKLMAKFFDYVTSSDSARIYFDITAKKTTNLACTNSTTILNYRFALPSLEEQEEIVSYLDAKCGEIDKLIKIKEQYLIELENYKQSLIYEYITGKREV